MVSDVYGTGTLLARFQVKCVLGGGTAPEQRSGTHECVRRGQFDPMRQLLVGESIEITPHLQDVSVYPQARRSDPNNPKLAWAIDKPRLDERHPGLL